MKKIIALSCLFFTQLAVADIFRVFRETDGSTNWQYIANFSSGIFIIALSLTIVRLFFSRRQSHRYNRELEEIKAIRTREKPDEKSEATLFMADLEQGLDENAE